MDLKEIEKLIKEAMPDAKIEIQDLAGDGNHYSATITSSTCIPTRHSNFNSVIE